MIIRLIVGQIKKAQYKCVNIFQIRNLQEKLKVELDLSNYATKRDLKNTTGIDALSFAKRVNLASLESNADILDIVKLKKGSN